jgi:phosphoglycolate phosphatase
MDIMTGRRAGTLTAGVASGESPARALRDAGAHVVAADCGELLAGLGLAGTGLTRTGLTGAEPDGQE